jgi:hypothetical protein
VDSEVESSGRLKAASTFASTFSGRLKVASAQAVLSVLVFRVRRELSEDFSRHAVGLFTSATICRGFE